MCYHQGGIAFELKKLSGSLHSIGRLIKRSHHDSAYGKFRAHLQTSCRPRRIRIVSPVSRLRFGDADEKVGVYVHAFVCGVPWLARIDQLEVKVSEQLYNRRSEQQAPTLTYLTRQHQRN